ncbi:LysR family transcriptional regulator [Vibrio kyushuensis]|uniref:LysR family transcriptional regulator n=1 Tax=Vibrio kyushuensis TaxID=2910249 RepID=UPI003D103082
MNISYEQIRAFVAVAEAGSFSAAARRLGKHRTTLGQVINNLEIEINMTLFDRGGKFPSLTEQGEALFTHAKTLHDNSTAFESLCQTMEAGVESDIRIYHTGLMPVSLIASTVQDVRKQYPHANIHWLHRSKDEVKSALKSGEADMGIVLIDATSRGASARDFIHLLSMPFTVVASPTFFNFGSKKISVRDVKTSRQLLLEDYYYSDIERTMQVSSVIERIETMSVLIELLKIGEGWAIAPVHAVQSEIESGALVQISVEELNTQLRYPLAIWFMNHSESGPVRKAITESLCQHSKHHEGLIIGK